MIFGGFPLLSPFVVTCSVWWGKANGSRTRCAPKFPSACRCFASQSGIERDLELFDEFALFAIDKWYQLPARSSVRKIQKVYERLVRLSGVWLHYEWTWKLARDLCLHLRRVALIRTRALFIRGVEPVPEFSLPP